MKIIYLGAEVGFKAALDVISKCAEFIHIQANKNDVAVAIREADAVLDASMKVCITDEMVKSSENLKIISCATTGSDHIEKNIIDQRNIPVRTLREDDELLLNLTPAAEHTWALLMACARKIPACLEHVREGKWTRELFPGFMLKNKQIGIIGCGRIGGWVARYANGFGMNIVGYDPYREELPKGINRVGLEEIFATSDVISVHVHLTDETKGMLNKQLFSIIKQNVIFLNTSRGALIDEQALLNGLESGKIMAAGLDVLEGEPDIDSHPLVEYARKNDKLIISPHCGGFSPDAVAIVCKRAAEKIVKHLGIADA